MVGADKRRRGRAVTPPTGAPMIASISVELMVIDPPAANVVNGNAVPTDPSALMYWPLTETPAIDPVLIIRMKLV